MTPRPSSDPPGSINPFQAAHRWFRSYRSWPFVLLIAALCLTAPSWFPPGEYNSLPAVDWWAMAAALGISALRKFLLARGLPITPHGRRARSLLWRLGRVYVWMGLLMAFTVRPEFIASATAVIVFGALLMAAWLLAKLYEVGRVRRHGDFDGVPEASGPTTGG
jgi:hypothetical protein